MLDSCLCCGPDDSVCGVVRRFVISFTHWTMQRKGAGIGEPMAPNGKVDDDPLCLGIHARETPEERSLRKRVFVRDDLPWCGTASPNPAGALLHLPEVPSSASARCSLPFKA